MISRLHYITQEHITGYTTASLVDQVCKGGVKWVQLRVKSDNKKMLKRYASEIKNICDKHQAKLIINDHVKIAKMVSAYGVHLGTDDMHIKKARDYLGDKYIIGGSANSLNDITRLHRLKVDYIGLGPYKKTNTKKNIGPLLGIDGIQTIVNSYYNSLSQNETPIPVIAIGGITIPDISLLLESGVYGIAVASAINLAKNKFAEASSFVNTIEKQLIVHE